MDKALFLINATTVLFFWVYAASMLFKTKAEVEIFKDEKEKNNDI